MSYRLHRTSISIEWGHCDPAGIVFNSRFFEFFDAALWDMFQSVLGVPRHKLTEQFGIVGFPLVEAGSTFVMPVKFGDDADLETAVSEFRRSSFDVTHRISVGGKLAAEGYEKRVWAGRDPADASRMKSAPIPAEVIDRFKIK